MFTFEWKPKAVEAIAREESGLPKVKEDGKFETYMRPPVFSGSVILKVPSHVDRLKMSKAITTKIKPDGEMVEDVELNITEKMFDFVKKHVQKVELVRIEDGMEFSSIEMLEYDKDGEDVFGSVERTLLEGVRLGKS